MTDLNTGIEQIVASVWATVLALPVQRADVDLDPSVSLVTCVVQVEGSWEGAIVLRVPQPLAVRIASAMFGGDATPGQADVHDALGEIANMVAGNVKSLLPPPCRITLPVVATGRDYQVHMPGTKPSLEVGFTCEETPFLVSVVEQSEQG